MNKNERRFLEQLFPGDPIWEENPITEIPPEVERLLEHVSCQTGVNVPWLERSARLVLEGLAGLHCLWFLHGASGSVTVASDPPDWLDPNKLLSAYMDKHFTRLTKDPNFVSVSAPKVEWGRGIFSFSITKNGKPVQRREVRLGKVLKELELAPGLIQTFENRQQTDWKWAISTHPFDVLTMSHNRAWTSCMRPGDVAEFGPLTDMAAGSAVLFWFRPDADKPCGRVILRPAVYYVDNEPIPAMIVAPTTKGNGPTPAEADLALHLEPLCSGVPVLDAYSLCLAGSSGRALSRHIYDDEEGDHCAQGDSVYKSAYKKLGELGWPEPRPVWKDDTRELATSLVDLVKELNLDEYAERIGKELAEYYMENAGDTRELLTTYLEVRPNGLPIADDLAHYELSDDQYSMIIGSIRTELRSALSFALDDNFSEVDAQMILIQVEDSSVGSDVMWHLTDRLYYELNLLRGEIEFDLEPFSMTFQEAFEVAMRLNLANDDEKSHSLIALPNYFAKKAIQSVIDDLEDTLGCEISMFECPWIWNWRDFEPT